MEDNRKEFLKQGQTCLANYNSDDELIKWAKAEDSFVHWPEK